VSAGAASSGGAPAPWGSDTVVDCLRRSAERARDNGITVYTRRGDVDRATYPQIVERASRVASGLASRLAPGDRVGLFLPSSVEYFVAYFGALMARAVPVSLPVPAFGKRLNQREEGRLAAIVSDARLATVIDGGGLDVAPHLPAARDEAGGKGARSRSPEVPRTALAELEAAAAAALPKELPGDPALIQYTSGSIASSRGVVLTERNISANVQAIARAVRMGQSDTIDLWIPLFHDMGLMGSLTTVASGANLRICSPSVFLADPMGWLLRFAARGSTINPSPNFFFRMLCDDYDPGRAAGLDLSRWRVAFNGAELVRPQDLERFQSTFGPHGFPASTMYPVYGLAESTLALTFPDYGSPPRVVAGDDVFARGAPEHLRSRRYVSTGRALPGHAIRLREVADEDHAHLPPEVGEILGKGPSIMAGYTSGGELVRPFVDGWLATRDIGFVHDGELFVCGRMDEVFTVRGTNYFPEDIEATTDKSDALAGVDVDARAAFRTDDPSLEGVALAIEVKRAPDDLPRRIARLEGDLLYHLGFPVRVVPLPPRAIPRTTSGKLRRIALARMIANGELTSKAAERA